MARDVEGARSAAYASVRPRYARIAAAGTSVLVTLVAISGATGLWSAGGAGGPAYAAPAVAALAADRTNGTDGTDAVSRAAPYPWGAHGSGPEHLGPVRATPPATPPATTTGTAVAPEEAPAAAADDTAAPPVPARSGRGRRVVFDEQAQRVWLVEADGDVRRTYPVSGSVTDNLDPGTYEVYSTSVDAVGIDDSGTMKYMVRFTRGERAAIGFHDIPVKDGKRLQTRAELGSPRSHGCIRQWRPDARALWAFAPVGTTVVVI